MLAGMIACWSISVDAADAEKAEVTTSIRGLRTPRQYHTTDTKRRRGHVNPLLLDDQWSVRISNVFSRLFPCLVRLQNVFPVL